MTIDPGLRIAWLTQFLRDRHAPLRTSDLSLWQGFEIAQLVRRYPAFPIEILDAGSDAQRGVQPPPCVPSPGLPAMSQRVADLSQRLEPYNPWPVADVADVAAADR